MRLNTKNIGTFFGLVFLGFFCLVEHVLAVNFAVLGDTQNFMRGNDNYQESVDSVSKIENISAVFVMGDLINNCHNDATCQKYWDKWKTIANPILNKTYPVMGNHDRVNANADAQWQSNFDLPTNGPTGYAETVYSLDKENAHFVILNSNPGHIINSIQRDWLEQDLNKNQEKEYIFVFFHAPAFPSSAHIGSALDKNAADRDALWNILDRYNVTAVFTGHEHLFSQRLIDSTVFPGATHPIYQFTVGNTAAKTHKAPKEGVAEYYYLGEHFAVIEAFDQKVKLDLYNPSGKKIYTFSFEKKR